MEAQWYGLEVLFLEKEIDALLEHFLNINLSATKHR